MFLPHSLKIQVPSSSLLSSSLSFLREGIELVQCISLSACPFSGYGGSSWSWDLQAFRSPAISGNFAGGIPRHDQCQVVRIISPTSSGSPSRCFATWKNIHQLLWCWLVGHSCHMAILVQLRLLYAE